LRRRCVKQDSALSFVELPHANVGSLRLSIPAVPPERYQINGLLEMGGAALAEARERNTEIVLRHGPVARDALADPFLQRRVKGSNGLLETGGAALALAGQFL
jgi:hypothetical protein